MMRNFFLIILLFTALNFFSCGDSKPKIETSPYFDLKDYFSKQAAELGAHNLRLKKFVLKNETSEEKLFDHPDWNEELKPFAECDINKPSWRNSYTIDSTGVPGSWCVKYMAKDSSLKIKSIHFCFEQDSLAFIRIEKRTDNMYYGYLATLNYFPLKAYTIQTSQKITLTKETVIEIKALFIP